MIRGWRVRNIAAAAMLGVFFAAGFYLAQLYAEISALIASREAALTSAVYSAPAPIRKGDDIERIALLGRLAHLSYSETPNTDSPGEFVRSRGAIVIHVRGYRAGAREWPARLIRVTLDGSRIAGVADAFGVALNDAALEPEVIGRLLPGAPAERVEVRLSDLKPYVARGLLANEDRFFYYHPGIDPIRILEAAIADLRTHHLAQGASTITQQLARTFMERRERSFGRKIRELAVAIVIEIKLSKNDILERYVNDVPMGSYEGTPIEGMPQAARYFFNRDLAQVDLAQAATLIGMIKAPTLFDPRRHGDKCLVRRNAVLAVMARASVIDDGAYRAAVAQPLKIEKAPGLRRAPYFTDYVIALVRAIAGFNGDMTGLKVYTTLDTELQSVAANAVQENLERIESQHRRLRREDSAERLESAMVALDAESGAIRAMVGGRDYAQSQFNRAALAYRQPGSAFKPIVYLAALDPSRAPFSPAMTLASVLPDELISYGAWTPANYERNYQPYVTVAQALIESLNVPTAYVGSRLGAPRIVETARELGITSDLPSVLPISIGADEVTLLELAGAYQVFAGAGMRATPYALESAIDARGREIFHHEDESRRVADPAVAYLITGALKAVLRYGTGASSGRLGLNFPAAGKTGTTQDYRDAYFIGYTPEIVAGVWVGFDTPESLGLTGAQAALPAWVKFMIAAAPGAPADFSEPSGITYATIDPETGGLATAGCPKAIELPFLIGSEPTMRCSVHGGTLASAPAAAPTFGMPPPSSEVVANAAMAAATPTPASSNVFGAIGNFFGGLFHR